MTRKEEIKQAAHKAYPYIGGTKGMICENSIPIFIQGAEWADSHPINQWHKVEDELPPRIKETVNVSKAVLVTDGTSYGVAYYNYALNAWRSVYFITITHWMPLSELP